MPRRPTVVRDRPAPRVLSAADQLRDHLLPGERLFWFGRPDPRIYGAAKMQPALYGSLIAFLWFLWFCVALFEEAPWGFSKWQIFTYALLPLLPALWLISIPLRRARRARRVAYGITDKRLIVLGEGSGGEARCFTPRDIQFLERVDHDGGLGSVFFRLAAQPLKRAWRTRVLWARYGLLGVSEPRAVEQRMKELAGF